MVQTYPQPAKIIVIGTSLGGLNALKIVLGGLPKTLGAAVAVVQHRTADPSSQLEVILRRHCALPVREPCDKEPIVPGRIYVAPADYHLLVEEEAFTLTTDEPVSYARPSVDVLFETASEAFGRNAIGVVLTGANYDGAKGAIAVKNEGGTLIVQSPEEAECAMMPEAAIRAATPDYVLSLADIAPLLTRLCPAA